MRMSRAGLRQYSGHDAARDNNDEPEDARRLCTEIQSWSEECRDVAGKVLHRNSLRTELKQ